MTELDALHRAYNLVVEASLECPKQYRLETMEIAGHLKILIKRLTTGEAPYRKPFLVLSDAKYKEIA